MLRSIVKTGVACAYSWSRVSRMTETTRSDTATPFIAGYHRVVEKFDHSRNTTIPSMLISTAMLERHIDWFSRRFAFASLDDIGQHLEGTRPLRKPSVAITFDDGYSDVYHHAYPLLRRKGIPAGFFVVTGLIGTGRPQVFDRLYLLLRRLQTNRLPLANTVSAALRSVHVDATPMKHLGASDGEPFSLMTATLNAFSQQDIEAALASLEERFPLPQDQLDEMAPVTWDMIETMHRGGVTIGSHTASHCLLPAETIETVRAELDISKHTLESRLGAAVNHFAYPDGRYSPEVLEAVKAAGYRFAYGNCLSRHPKLPLLTIPRKVLWERSCVNALGRFSPSIMNCHVHFVFDRRNHCEHDHNSPTGQHGKAA